MESVSLQFQGVRDLGLLVTVMSAVAVTLVAYGVWHLVRGRSRLGLACLAAVLPTAVVLLLAGEIGLGFWMAAMGLQVALAVGVFYAAVYAYLGRRRMGVLVVMRVAAIAALLLVLFKPAVSVVPSAESQRPRLVVLMDRSGSMATADQPGAASRYVQCFRDLERQRDRLRGSFRPAYYHFARDLQGVESPEALGRLQPTGEGTDVTDLATALRDSAAAYDKADLAGVLLFSDGLHNASADLPKAAEGLRGMGVPVYAIGVGAKTESQTGRKNLQLVSVGAPFDAVKNNVSTIRATVKATGLAGAAAEVRLLEDGNVVASAPIRTDQGADAVTCDLKWTPRDAPGQSRPTTDPAGRAADVRRLTVSIPPLPEETTPRDNDAQVHVLVTEPKVRLLYVEGTIRPEYKFLWRALNMDPQVQLVSLVRVQKNEFSATGTIQGRELKDLPRTDEDFRLFDVIVLGDIDSTFLDAQQMARLKKFVTDGGGLLMLGGHNSFGPGGYGGTDVEAVLPVFTGPRGQGQDADTFLPLLTADGVKHPIFDGIADYFPSPQGPPKPGLPRLPDLLGSVRVAGAKPGASVLAVRPAKGGETAPPIVLAVQPFGAGRSAAFTADTTWQWYMTLQGKNEESPYRLFWGQLVRWLASVQTKSRAGSGSLVLRLDSPAARAATEVKVAARVLDEQGKPPKSAVVSCSLQPAGPAEPGGAAAPPRAPEAAQPETFNLTYNQASGLFEGACRPRKEGRYALRAGAADPATQKPIASDELPLDVWPLSPELDTLARSEPGLQTLAERTGGAYADLSGLPEVLDKIVDRQKSQAAPATVGATTRLYNFPLLLVVFVALLTGEWLLRRNWQLQ